MRKILLVDDDKDVLDVMIQFFKEHDLDVIYSLTGEDAVELIFANSPDLVVLDVNLPGINGLDVLRNIKSNKIISFIPVIMLTGQDSAHSQVDGLTSGADDYVTKPFDLSVLYARMLTVFRRTLVRTRLKYDQYNLLRYLIGIYKKRKYEIFTKLLSGFPDSPIEWNGFVPDFIIMKKNKLRCFVFETSQTILEESFLDRAQSLHDLLNQDYKNIESIIVVRTQENYHTVKKIISEYGYNVNVKLIKKHISKKEKVQKGR